MASVVGVHGPSFSPFDLCSIVHGRFFFPFVASPPLAFAFAVPGITGGASERYIPKVVTRSVFSARVAPRQSRATTLSTIWHKSTRCSTLGEIRPPLSPYCLPSSPFFPFRRVPGGERRAGSRAAIRADLPIINSTRLSTLRQCTLRAHRELLLTSTSPLPIVLRFLLYVPSSFLFSCLFFLLFFSFLPTSVRGSLRTTSVHGTRLFAESVRSSMKFSS